jgi:hypothetical protein
MNYPTPDNNHDRAETYRALQSHNRVLSADHDVDPTLDRAVVALRNQPVPEGPPQSLLAKTLISLREKQPRVLASSRNSLRNPWRFPFRPLALAAGLLFAIGAIAIVALVLLSSTSVAFADVARKVRNSRTLTFTADTPLGSVKVFAIEGRQLRMETGDRSVVFDAHANTGLLLDRRTRYAVVIDNPNVLFRHRNNDADFVRAIQALKNLGNKPERELGERTWSGKTLRGFVATQDDITFTVWADPRTGDPARIEFGSPGDGDSLITFTDIQIDAPIDPAKFNLKIPPGYNRLQIALPNVEGGEPSLLIALRGYTDRTGGRFPSRLTDWSDFAKVLRADALKAALSGAKPQPGALAGLSGEALEYVSNVAAITPFLSSLPADNYAYLGAGKSTGDSTQIIFWHKTPEGAHRAIFSDLTAREVNPEEIPK